MIDIQPQYLDLQQLFEGRLFNIPDYQRAYSWKKRQRDDLFEDINKLDERVRLSDSEDEIHYLAPVVCLRTEKIRLGIGKVQKLDIVDGQQRLTTIILLLNSIKLALESKAEEECSTAKDPAAEELENLLVKKGGDLILLQTNHDTSHYFSNFLRLGKVADPKGATTHADRELLHAMNNCRQFVDEWMKKGKLPYELIDRILNGLTVILHEVADQKTVYTIFEVLNSRGLTVSWFDRLKSILMGKAYEIPEIDNDALIKELRNIWRDIYAELGKVGKDGSEPLRYAATLYDKSKRSKIMSERDSVDTFRKEAQSSEKIYKIANFLLSVTKAYCKLISNPRLNGVTRISQARFLGVAIELGDTVNSTEKANLLKQWEKTTFRIYGLSRKDARVSVGDYVRLAWRIVKENPRSSEILSDIEIIGNRFPIEDAIGIIEDSGNCYDSWQEELRYFMYRYEEHLRSKENMHYENDEWIEIWSKTASNSIEHIYPQSKAKETRKHNLGNLLVIPPNLNSKLGNKPFQEKRKSYMDTGLAIAKEVGRNKTWTYKKIKERQSKLLEFAKAEWGN